MPVSKHLIGRCPLLLESDFLSLSPLLKVQDNVLRDQTTGARHVLDVSAVALVKQLAQGVPYGQFVASSKKLGLHHSQTTELVGFLNIIGGIVRKRTISALLKAVQVRATHLLLGIWYAPLSWRGRASKGSIAHATFRATMPVIAAAFAVGSIQVYAGLGDLRRTTTVMIYGLGILIASIVAHELSHVYVVRKAGNKCSVLQSGMHVGIIHPRAQPATEAISSLAGPLTGTGLCMVSGGIMLLLDQTILAFVSSIVSICHFCSLLPLYGDGISFVNALRKKREPHEEHTQNRTP